MKTLFTTIKILALSAITFSSYASEIYELPEASHAPEETPVSTVKIYAESVPVSINPLRDGVWQTSGDTDTWVMQFTSNKATSIEFGFTRYFVPVSAEITLRDVHTGETRGPYTSEHNTAGQLWTAFLPSDTVELQITVNPAERELVYMHIAEVYIGYQASIDKSLGDSGGCHIDVQCDAAQAYSPQARATAMIASGGRLCSATLLNNTEQDGRPLLLTANHCVKSEQDAAEAVVYWNYTNSGCGNQDGNLLNSQSGAKLLVAHETSDTVLLELNHLPAIEYNVHYAGWDARNVIPQSTYSFHHPRGDAKKFAQDFDPLTQTYYRSDHISDSGTHWRVADWDQGSTEAGSSGGGLWTADNRIIGQLHGGKAACGNDKPDWYGRLADAWEGDGGCNTALKYWLNPISEGEEHQLTMDGNDIPNAVNSQAYPRCQLAADDAYEDNSSFNKAFSLDADILLRSTSGDGVQLNEDWYQFSLEEASTVIIDLLFEDNKGDLSLFLYNQFQQKLVSSETFTNNERIVATLEVGDYYVLVNGAIGSDGEPTITGNSYNFVWSHSDQSNDSKDDSEDASDNTDSNSSTSTPSEVSGDKSGGGSISAFWLYLVILITVRRHFNAVNRKI